jgi:hypothetical protein
MHDPQSRKPCFTEQQLGVTPVVAVHVYDDLSQAVSFPPMGDFDTAILDCSITMSICCKYVRVSVFPIRRWSRARTAGGVILGEATPGWGQATNID